jgi:hypothetical protein
MDQAQQQLRLCEISMLEAGDQFNAGEQRESLDV